MSVCTVMTPFIVVPFIGPVCRGVRGGHWWAKEGAMETIATVHSGGVLCGHGMLQDFQT